MGGNPTPNRPSRLRPHPKRRPGRLLAYICETPERKPRFCQTPQVGIPESSTQKPIPTCGNSVFRSKSRNSTGRIQPTAVSKCDLHTSDFENHPRETRFPHVEIESPPLTWKTPTCRVFDLSLRSPTSTPGVSKLSSPVPISYVWRICLSATDDVLRIRLRRRRLFWRHSHVKYSRPCIAWVGGCLGWGDTPLCLENLHDPVESISACCRPFHRMSSVLNAVNCGVTMRN
jgi:hypothetical protein